MAFDKLYYTNKKQKLLERIQQEKDEFLVELVNNLNKFLKSQQEKNEGLQETLKVIEENEKLEKEKKDGKKEAKK